MIDSKQHNLMTVCIIYIFLFLIIENSAYAGDVGKCDSDYDTSGRPYIPSCQALIGKSSKCFGSVGLDSETCKACTGMTCQQCTQRLGEFCTKIPACQLCKKISNPIWSAVMSAPVGRLPDTDIIPESMDVIKFDIPFENVALKQYFEKTQFQYNCTKFPLYYDPRIYDSIQNTQTDISGRSAPASTKQSVGFVEGDIFCQNTYIEMLTNHTTKGIVNFRTDFNAAQETDFSKQWLWVTPDICASNPDYCKDLPYCDECINYGSSESMRQNKLCQKNLCYSRGSIFFNIDTATTHLSEESHPKGEACFYNDNRGQEQRWFYNHAYDSSALDSACKYQYGDDATFKENEINNEYQCIVFGDNNNIYYTDPISNECVLSLDNNYNEGDLIVNQTDFCNCGNEEVILCLNKVSDPLMGSEYYALKGFNENIFLNKTNDYQTYELQKLLDKACKYKYGDNFVADCEAYKQLFTDASTLENPSINISCVNPSALQEKLSSVTSTESCMNVIANLDWPYWYSDTPIFPLPPNIEKKYPWDSGSYIKSEVPEAIHRYYQYYYKEPGSCEGIIGYYGTAITSNHWMGSYYGIRDSLIDTDPSIRLRARGNFCMYSNRLRNSDSIKLTPKGPPNDTSDKYTGDYGPKFVWTGVKAGQNQHYVINGANKVVARDNTSSFYTNCLWQVEDNIGLCPYANYYQKAVDSDTEYSITIQNCSKNPKCLFYANEPIETKVFKSNNQDSSATGYVGMCGPVKRICNTSTTPIMLCDSPFLSKSNNILTNLKQDNYRGVFQDLFYYYKFLQLDNVLEEARQFSQPSPQLNQSINASFVGTKIMNNLYAEKKGKLYAYFFKKFSPIFNPDELNSEDNLRYSVNGTYWNLYEDIIKNKLCSGKDIVLHPECFVEHYKQAEYIENHLQYFCSIIERNTGLCRKQAVSFVNEIFKKRNNKKFYNYMHANIFYTNFINAIQSKPGVSLTPTIYHEPTYDHPGDLNRPLTTQPPNARQPTECKNKGNTKAPPCKPPPTMHPFGSDRIYLPKEETIPATVPFGL